jgi:hypothetical protein
MPNVNPDPAAFRKAAEFKMPYGKYMGQTLDSIAMTDDGLRYLDWLYGECERRNTDVRRALHVYLGDPTVTAEIERALEGE